MTESVILLVLGAVVGSFLNVVGLRWRSGFNLGGRSFCTSCGKTLRPWELVPILSFITLRGKCARCSTRISWQYPLVELWTALIFVTVPYFLIPALCIYVVITIYDFRHKIIPDSLVYSSIIYALGVRVIVGGTTLDWLAGPIIFAFFASIWLVSKGRAMGFGDAKLGLSVGLLLGASQGFSAIVLAFWIGAGLTLLAMLLVQSSSLLRGGKKLTMKSEIPFAPFIILGAWIVLWYPLDLLHVLSLI